jgi:hypothetical protein
MLPFVTSIEHGRAIAQALRFAIGFHWSDRQTQDVSANLLGYATWGEFVDSPREPESAFDAYATAIERENRRDWHVHVLVAQGIPADVAARHIDRIEPTAMTDIHRKKIGQRQKSTLATCPHDSLDTRANIPSDVLSSKARFRGVGLRWVKEILKLHADWRFPTLAEIASAPRIDMDARRVVGLLEELRAAGFLREGATETGLPKSAGGFDVYREKPLHISDQGKLLFKPGTNGVGPISVDAYPLTVDLDRVDPEFVFTDAGWYGGVFLSSRFNRPLPRGFVHTENSYDTELHDSLNLGDVEIITPSTKKLKTVAGAFELDGRDRFGMVSNSDDMRRVVIVERSLEFGKDDWRITLSLTSAERPEIVKRDRGWNVSFHEEDIISFQSVIATLVSADLWRLCHRRDALGLAPEITIALRCPFEDSEIAELYEGVFDVMMSQDYFLDLVLPHQRVGIRADFVFSSGGHLAFGYGS